METGKIVSLTFKGYKKKISFSTRSSKDVPRNLWWNQGWNNTDGTNNDTNGELKTKQMEFGKISKKFF